MKRAMFGTGSPSSGSVGSIATRTECGWTTWAVMVKSLPCFVPMLMSFPELLYIEQDWGKNQTSALQSVICGTERRFP